MGDGGAAGGTSAGRGRPIAVTLVLAALASASATAGCGDDGGAPAVDAGDDAARTDAGPASGDRLPSGATLGVPAMPALPAPATIPCTPGWRAIPALVEGGQPACDPWPATGLASCTPAEAHRPGEPGCTTVGLACSGGPFADDLPAGTTGSIVYVRADAPSGGDGSLSAPFSRMSDAMAVAASGTVVALGKGTYTETLAVPAGVTLWGACAAETHVVAPAGATGGAAVTLSAGSGMRNVSVAGPLAGVLVSAPGATLAGVIVDGATGAGIWVRAGGTLDAHDVTTRAVAVDPMDAGSGIGILVDAGGVARVERAFIASAFHAGVEVRGGSSLLTLTDSVVRGTDPAVAGFGAAAVGGGEVRLERVAVEANRAAGVRVATGGTAAIASSVVRDTAADRGTGTVGIGLNVDGASARMERTLVERCIAIGIHVQGDGALELTDVVIRDTRPTPHAGTPADVLGTGLDISLGRATADRVSVEQSLNAGVTVSTEPTEVAFTDLTVLGSAHSPGDLASGEALVVSFGAHATITRALFRGSEQHGVWIDGAATRATFVDVTVQDVAPRASDGDLGAGVDATNGAMVTMQRLLVERATAMGIMSTTGSTLDVTDATVLDTRAVVAPNPLTGFGFGLFAALGATLNATRAHVEGAHGMGITVVGPDTHMNLVDLRVTRTESWAVGGGLLGTLLGRGIDVQRDAHAQITRALFDDNREVGVFVTGDLVIRDAIVRDTRPDAQDNIGGLGMVAAAGGQIDGSDLRVEQNRHIGISAIGGGTRVTVDRVEVLDTMQNLCAVDTCAGSPAGLGIGAYEGAALRATHFRVAGSALCGVQVARDGQMDLSDGEVSGSPIGANVQVAGFDVGRLTSGVVYRDNGRNLDASMLPVPAAGPPIETPPPPEPL